MYESYFWKEAVMLSASYLGANIAPFLPRILDDSCPIPSEFLTWHELADHLFGWLYIMVLLVVYWRTLPTISLSNIGLFMGLACIQLNGHGMHIAANAIHNLSNPGQKYQANFSSSDKAIYFFDETAGHFLLFFGSASLQLLILWGDHKLAKSQVAAQPSLNNISLAKYAAQIISTIIFGLVHGTIWFGACVEGQQVYSLGLFVSTLMIFDFLLTILLMHERTQISLLFHTSGLFSMILFASWAYKFQGDFPEFRVLNIGPFSNWPGHFASALGICNGHGQD